MHWKDHKINLIDTPGHVDFTVEVERCARVLDGVIVVIDAVSGQAQTRTVWKQTQRRKLPAIVFVNKMDRTGASFSRALDGVRNKLGANPVPLQLPLGSEDKFNGVVDLVAMERIEWQDSGKKNRPQVVQTAMQKGDPFYDEAKEARKDLIESLAESDEVFMEIYLESQESGDKGNNFTVDELTGALRRACLSGSLVPAICGASLRGMGVECALDAVVSYLPSPTEVPPTTATHIKNGKSKEISVVNTNDLCLLAFKIVHDSKRGPLVFVRNYAGALSDRAVLFNVSQGKKERVNQLLLVTADDLDQVKYLGLASRVFGWAEALVLETPWYWIKDLCKATPWRDCTCPTRFLLWYRAREV